MSLMLAQTTTASSSLIAGLIVAGVAGAATIIAALLTRRRRSNASADYADQLVEASQIVVEQLRRQLDETNKRCSRCERHNEAMTRYLRSMGLDPPEMPNDLG